MALTVSQLMSYLEKCSPDKKVYFEVDLENDIPKGYEWGSAAFEVIGVVEWDDVFLNFKYWEA